MHMCWDATAQCHSIVVSYLRILWNKYVVWWDEASKRTGPLLRSLILFWELQLCFVCVPNLVPIYVLERHVKRAFTELILACLVISMRLRVVLVV